MNRCSIFVLSLIAAAAIPLSGVAAEYAEDGDAPDGVPASQLTTGVGPLTAITGELNPAAGDHIDTYCIKTGNIDDPSLPFFYASTSPTLGGTMASPGELLANARMWLWNESGPRDGIFDVLLANDNDQMAGALGAATISEPEAFSMLTGGGVASSAMGVTLQANHTYLLSISEFPNDPQDSNGTDLADFGPPPSTDLVGKNSMALEFVDWERTANTGLASYTIALQSAQFCAVPEPAGMFAWLVVAAAMGYCWRK